MHLRLQSQRDRILFSAGITLLCLAVTNIVNYMAFGPPLYYAVAQVGSLTAFLLGSTISYWVSGKLLAITQLTQQLEHALRHDNLTGVSTRRYFFERAQSDPVYPASLIMVDVDHFKAINDTYGHDGGDRALAHVARTLQAELRGGDCIARFGGEEFIVLVVQANTAQGALVAERMCAALANAPFLLSEKAVRLTASFGVTPVASIDGIDAALRRADAALYEAKAAGRNQVICLPTERQKRGSARGTKVVRAG